MLATLRRVAACLILLAFILSFIPWGGTEPCAALWLVERVQFLPALLGAWSGRVWACLVLGVLLLLTLIFGRVFCSWLCPLGMLQDIANRAARPRPGQRKGKSVRFAPNHPWLRGGVALLAFGSLAAGGVGLLTWLDPYSIAARAMAAFGNPVLSLLAGSLGAELPPPDWTRYAPWAMAVAGFSLAVPLAMAVWRGRLYCNTLCPVGAVLGLLSRLAPCTPHIDEATCGRCGSCMKHCKAQAIDVKNKRVDATRCVGCYNCLSACSRGAMTLRPRHPFRPAQEKSPAAAPAGEQVEDASRRAFLGMGAVTLATTALPEVPQAEPSTNPGEQGNNEAPAAVPPGAQSVERFLSHCTACGLCIANCPTGVLRPSLLSLGLRGFMKPTLDFTRAACDPNCTNCSASCPAGALLPLSPGEKLHTQVGLVHFRQGNCLVWRKGISCVRCVKAGNCPTGALVVQEVNVPAVDADRCRGCRRCISVCPVGAITRVKVEGRERLLAVIDYGKCIGCGACAAACRPQAIALSERTAPRLAHPEKCIGCGRCEHACPAQPQKALRVAPRARHLKTPQN